MNFLCTYFCWFTHKSEDQLRSKGTVICNGSLVINKETESTTCDHFYFVTLHSLRNHFMCITYNNMTATYDFGDPHDDVYNFEYLIRGIFLMADHELYKHSLDPDLICEHR